MTRGRQALVGIVALAAGAGTAGAVAIGAEGGGSVITLRGSNVAQERQGTLTGTLPMLTISGGFRGMPITIEGRGDSAQADKDFRVKPQVITLSGQELGQVVTLSGGIADDEIDEPAERFFVDACGPSATGQDDGDCDDTDDARVSHPITIADDDGALDAVICSGLLRPVGLLLSQLKIAGLFEGCS